MMQVTTAQKVRILARVAAQQASRSRTAGAVLQGARTTLTHFGRVLHQLWLEVTGFVFLALAGIGGLAGVREFAKFEAGKAGAGSRLAVAICFCLTFAYFGLSSFWRVRKKSKRRGRESGCIEPQQSASCAGSMGGQV
ncbi:MAG TPA: hypothetical protein VFA89_00115 [Terriglobales bacterium]|nr:hypothetical protein [Terriglobales bacterium]